MTKESTPTGPTSHAAGGWPALGAGAKHVARQGNIRQTVKTLLKVNQPDGFDCPGCAWPEPDDPSRFEFCENGIKAVAWESTAKRVGPDFFARYTVSDLQEQSDHWLESQGRLTHPMRYHAATDRYEPVSWAQAFERVAQVLREMQGPERAAFYTSGRTSNEAAFLYQLFVRRVGTNNLPDCSNLCHESSGVALTESVGTGKGTVRLEDFDHADLILVVGQNPGTNHPRMLTELRKASQRGAMIAAINPLKEPGLLAFLHPQKATEMLVNKATPIAEQYIQPKIGGDLALIKGLCKSVLERDRERGGGVIDQAFIDEHTAGYETLTDDLDQTNWDQITHHSGVDRDAIEQLADRFVKSKACIACWAMGLTQHKHAVATIQMLTNLLLMRGHIGRRGAGLCPVRGHSNVQGDRTMGITEQPTPAFNASLKRVFGFDPPTEHGLDAVGAIEAMDAGRIDVFFGMGGNFVSASPDTRRTDRAMRKCKLTVQVSTKLNRSHLAVGDDALILPCLGRTELDVRSAGPQRLTVEDSASQVHASVGQNKPASEHLLSEPAIVAGLAIAMFGEDDAIDWRWLVEDYARIRDKIAEVLPNLFEGFNQKIDTPGGFYLGNTARERVWATASGKAQFTPAPIPDLDLPAGQLRLMTLRSHDQYNTTVYGMNDRYRGITGTRMIVMMHEGDVAERGLVDGQAVDLESHFEDGESRVVRGFSVVCCDIPRGCAAGYFPEMNPLVSAGSYAKRSRTPTSKLIPVTVVAQDA